MDASLSLAAECGTSREAAECFAAHFPAELRRRDGTLHRLEIRVTERAGHGHWCMVQPTGLSTRGIHCDREEEVFDDLAAQLYGWLKTAPAYRYARVGLGVERFREYAELNAEIGVGNFSGMVIEEPLWRELGAPSTFEPFGGGYRWRPYRGCS